MINQIIILIIMVGASAFFSMSETAITSISRIKLKKLLSQGTYGAKALYELRENPGKMLSTILLGNNLVNISAASLATYVVMTSFEKHLIFNSGIIVTVASLIMTFIILIFGEIAPKTIAIKNAEKLALIVAPVIKFLAFIFFPIVMFTNYLCRPLIKFFGGDVSMQVPFVTEEELKMLLSVSEEEGIIEREEKEMIHSIFEFGDSIVKEVMVPKPDMFCLDVETPISEAMIKISDEGHSRIPIYEGAIDNIIGLVYIKDLLSVCVERKASTLREMLRPPLFVPETKKLDDLMRQMQSLRSHIAIVVDEYGGVAGLVSLEDLLEEIVGEIRDEFDSAEKEIEIMPDSSFLVDARLTLKQVNEKIESSLPEGDYDTIGGFVLSLTGKLPTIGDRVTFDNLRFVVDKVSKRRIVRLRISRIADGELEGNIVGG